MRQRILTGAILLLLFVPVFFLADTIIFNIVIAFLSMIGTYEMLHCTSVLPIRLLSIPALIYSLCTPLFARFSYGLLSFLTVVFLFYVFFVSVFTNDDVKTEKVCVVFATTFYITVSFTSIIKVHDVAQNGYLIYFLIFIGAWVTDTFAYFVGKIFGKHKLSPVISPKKTIEGSVGGIVFCVLAFLAFGTVTKIFFDKVPNYFGLALLGFVLSVVGQLGDLTLSAVKRNYGIKDFGKLFPGHGGVLDRFDSIMVLGPVLLMFTGNEYFIHLLFLA